LFDETDLSASKRGRPDNNATTSVCNLQPILDHQHIFADLQPIFGLQPILQPILSLQPILGLQPILQPILSLQPILDL
jgi:hypothetical protein